MERCETCKWWNNGVSSAIAEHEDTGRCIVNPPKADKRTGLAYWPFTDADDACGKHEPAAEPTF